MDNEKRKDLSKYRMEQAEETLKAARMCSTICCTNEKKIIDPDTLHQLDTTAITVPYDSGKSEVSIQKLQKK